VITGIVLITQASDKRLKLKFLKRIDIENGARPEIVVTKDRVFVVYLDIGSPRHQTFQVKIFDKEMDAEIGSRTLVSSSPVYGQPTDIRGVSDGEYAYAFYEKPIRRIIRLICGVQNTGLMTTLKGWDILTVQSP